MIELLTSSLRLATPLLFAAMGGLICERAGIATICLEGAMLAGAWTAAAYALWSGDPWTALVVGGLSGALILSLHAWLTLHAKADAIVSGVAVNLIAAGATPLLCKIFYSSPTNTPQLDIHARLGPLNLPLLSSIPYLGPLFSERLLVYLALILPWALHAFFWRTRPGLWIYAAGDGPEALETAGVRVRRVRWAALVTGGALAAIGGAFLSISHASQFTRDMTSGRGYIALAALIFGRWRPIPTLYACLFFGLADALQIQLQSADLFGVQVPVQVLQAFPYVLTLIVLVGAAGRAVPPRAIGN